MTEIAPLPLVLSMGDPAGVGPIITAKAWDMLKDNASLAFYVIGAPDLYRDLCPVQVIFEPSEALAHFGTALPVLPVGTMPAISAGTPDAAAAPAIIAAIETGVRHVQSGLAAGLVTNPINKALLYGAGFRHPGHTEFIAELCRPVSGDAPRPVMMLTGGGLRVALATIHIPLANVSGSLSQESLIELGTIVHHALKTDFGISAPRIAFTGLNPHAGESGTIGREEVDIINPAAETLRSRGISISDARPGDTVFAEALSGAFDAVIAMTHDQGLIPVKTLDFWGGVNMTLGLPIVRTSPDHGTGYDAAAAGTARPDSLIAAIRAAAMVAHNRQTV